MISGELFMDVLLSPEEENHCGTEGELLYVLEGTLHVSLPQRALTLSPEDIFYITPGLIYALHSGAQDTLLCRFTIDPAFLSQNGRHLSLWCSSQDDPDASSYAELRRTLRTLLSTKGKPDLYYARMSAFYHLLDHLLAYHTVAAEQTDNAQDRLMLIRQYVEQNYKNKISLQDLSRMLHYSPAHLSRLIKRYLGTTFTGYVHNVRLHHVTEQLKNTSRQITEIALDCGFMSISALNKVFQQKYNCSPSAYRQSHAVQKDIDQEAEKRLLIHLGELEPDDVMSMRSEQTLRVDRSAPATPLKPIWNFAANAGSFAAYCLGPHDKTFSFMYDLGMRHIRFSHLLDRRIIQPMERGQLQYMFAAEIGESIYELTESSMAPFFRLESWHVYCQEAEQNPDCLQLSSLGEYMDAMRQFIAHLGSFDFQPALTGKWIFELWEPDAQFLNEDYFSLYRMLQEMISAVLPNASLGGSGARVGHRANSERQLVCPWEQHGVRPDFYSVSFYPYTEDENHHGKYSSDQDALAKTLDQLRAVIPSDSAPVYVTEWGPFLSNNYFNDSLWRASYTIRAMSSCIGKADALIATMFFDSQNKSGTILPLRGEPGLLTNIALLRKPVYFALRSLRTMSSNLLLNEPGCMVTSNGFNRFQLVLYHYQHFNSAFYHVKDEKQILPGSLSLYLQDVGNRSFTIELTGVEEGTYKVELYRVTKARSSILDRWIENDCFPYDGKSRLLSLILNANIDTHLQSVTTVRNTLKLNYILQPSEVYSISITKM